MRRRYVMASMAALAFAGCARTGTSAPCVRRTFEGSAFTVCRYDPATDRVSLRQADAGGHALRTFDRLGAVLGADAAKVKFAMNAGMFDANGAPIGLYIENGQMRHALNTGSGDGNFYMRPNGVLFVTADGAVNIETTPAFAKRNTLPPWATQSGPMLVSAGVVNPAFASDGQSHNIRNAAGTGADGTVFVISEDAVSFGRLARFMRDGLGCMNALYLDGYVSSLWAPSLHRKDARADLGPMLVVTAQ